jgi:hypothetical protein
MGLYTLIFSFYIGNKKIEYPQLDDGKTSLDLTF